MGCTVWPCKGMRGEHARRREEEGAYLQGIIDQFDSGESWDRLMGIIGCEVRSVPWFLFRFHPVTLPPRTKSYSLSSFTIPSVNAISCYFMHLSLPFLVVSECLIFYRVDVYNRCFIRWLIMNKVNCRCSKGHWAPFYRGLSNIIGETRFVHS